LQCVAVCCSVLQCVDISLQYPATHCNTLQHTASQRASHESEKERLERARKRVRCSVLQCVDMSLQYPATHCNTLQAREQVTRARKRDSSERVRERERKCVAVCCRMLICLCPTLQQTATHSKSRERERETRPSDSEKERLFHSLALFLGLACWKREQGSVRAFHFVLRERVSLSVFYEGSVQVSFFSFQGSVRESESERESSHGRARH